MSNSELKQITPLTSETRNFAEELNIRYKQIENEIDKDRTEITGIKTKNTEQDIKISQLSNPNLLDNGDYQIWNYGANHFISATGGYWVDRWLFWSEKPFDIYKGGDGGIQIHNKEAVSIAMYQILTFKNIDFKYEGFQKTVTLSVDDNGHILKLTAKLAKTVHVSVNTSTGELIFKKLYQGTDDNRFIAEFWSHKNKAAARTIYYMKLEYGEIATPFFPKLQAVEELECSRYNRWLTTGTTASVVDSTSIVLSARFETPMRITPTMTVKNKVVASFSNGYIPEITNPVIYGAVLNKNGIQFIHVGGGGGITVPIGTRVVLQSENVIQLDANIYP